MNKEFIPEEQALDLKELGFDEPCMAQWNDSNGFDGFGGNYRNSYFTYPDQVAAPLYQQAFRWFREKYNLHSTIHLNSKGYFATITKKVNNLTPCIFSSEIFNAPEEAELECLKKLIEIVKEK